MNTEAVRALRAVRVFGTPGPELTKALEPLPVTSRALHLGGFTR